jgi:osmotically-inducible protein OsmY
MLKRTQVPLANFEVIVDGDITTIRGNVNSEDDKRAIGTMIRMTPGVHGLKNEIVAPAPPLPPGK